MISRRAHLAGLVALACGGLACAPPRAPPPPMPPGISWTGGWDSTFGALVLEQKGEEVLGVYKYPNGAITTTGMLTGRMHGARLDFAWEEREGGSGRGHGILEMQPDGASFTGTWGYGASTRNGADWVGKRVP